MITDYKIQMKKLLLIACFMLTAIISWAAKAYTLPVTVTQSDGTKLTVISHGDEDYHWYTATDGTLLVHVGYNFYIAKIDEEGDLQPTKQLAHNPGERSVEENALISQQDKNKFHLTAPQKLTQSKARRIPINNNPRLHYTPHEGNVKGIVILVEFSDTAFTLPNPRKSFDYYLNGNNYGDPELRNGEASLYGSVNKYFKDNSFGQFSPTFDIYGPIKLDYKQSDFIYGKSKEDLLRLACKAVDDSLDFSRPEYDSNGDGYVDFVGIIFAGYSSSIIPNPSWWLWPSSNGSNIGTFDNKNVYRWLVTNELNGFPGAYTREPYHHINGIGLFCHEFSHCLGLPDMYPTKNDAKINNQEMEQWDLMDGGEYVSNGNCPPTYTAWERETMEWMTIDTLKTDQKGIEIKPIDEGGKAYRIMNPNDNTKREYFMIENIQQKRWNSKQRGHGLLVYHVNYEYDVVSVSDFPNDKKGYPRMAIVPADGLVLSSYIFSDLINPATNKPYTQAEYFAQLSGDPFPGINNVTTLNYSMELPNYLWYNGEKAVKPALENIQEADNGTILFDFISDVTDGISNIQLVSNPDDSRIYTIDGRLAGSSVESLPKGLYIINKKKVFIK